MSSKNQTLFRKYNNFSSKKKQILSSKNQRLLENTTTFSSKKTKACQAKTRIQMLFKLLLKLVKVLGRAINTFPQAELIFAEGEQLMMRKENFKSTVCVWVWILSILRILWILRKISEKPGCRRPLLPRGDSFSRWHCSWDRPDQQVKPKTIPCHTRKPGSRFNAFAFLFKKTKILSQMDFFRKDLIASCFGYRGTQPVKDCLVWKKVKYNKSKTKVQRHNQMRTVNQKVLKRSQIVTKDFNPRQRTDRGL